MILFENCETSRHEACRKSIGRGGLALPFPNLLSLCLVSRCSQIIRNSIPKRGLVFYSYLNLQYFSKLWCIRIFEYPLDELHFWRYHFRKSIFLSLWSPPTSTSAISSLASGLMTTWKCSRSWACSTRSSAWIALRTTFARSIASSDSPSTRTRFVDSFGKENG